LGTVFVQEPEHLEWADILKGLGILTVVWGHAGSNVSFYMFWFHMPLFFWVSGYLTRFKPMSKQTSFIKRKVTHLLVPYVFYLSLLTPAMIVFDLWKNQPLAQLWFQNGKALVLGGSLLEGVYATFWFPTCLFFVQIAYDLLCRKVTSSYLKGFFILGCFLLAYWESYYYPNSFVPWNLDVGLYAIVFYALGHFLREKRFLEVERTRRVIFGIAWLVILGFICLYAHHILDYGLDMKHRQYYYFGLNLILPLAFTLLFVQLSMMLTTIKAVNWGLSYIGKAAMVIMYLHLFAVYAARQFIGMTPIRFFVVGTIVPILFYTIVKYIPMGRYLALGEISKGGFLHFFKERNRSFNE
jgi:fucose 4-O-acetylase-like acetyltransferase